MIGSEEATLGSGFGTSDVAGGESLVTFTLLRNADLILNRQEFSVKSLFDLATLVDAIVLHSRILVFKGSVPQEFYPKMVIEALEKAKLICFYQPSSFGSKEITSAINQYSMFRDLSWWGNDWYIKDQLKFIGDSTRLLDHILHHFGSLDADSLMEASGERLFRESDINTFIEYLRSHNKQVTSDFGLFDLVHLMATGAEQDLRHFLFRTIVYLCAADFDKITFYPDYARIPYVCNCVDRLYSSLTRETYELIAKAFNTRVEEVMEETPGYDIVIPPFLAMVLEKVTRGMVFLDALLEVRADFEGTRKKLSRIDHDIRKAQSISDRRKLIKRKNEVLASAAIKYERPEGLQIRHYISFAEDITRVAVNPMDPSAYNHSLLVKPYDWIRQWWLARPVSHLVNAVERLENLPRQLDLIRKGLGYDMDKLDIELFTRARQNVASLTTHSQKDKTRRG